MPQDRNILQFATIRHLKRCQIRQVGKLCQVSQFVESRHGETSQIRQLRHSGDAFRLVLLRKRERL